MSRLLSGAVPWPADVAQRYRDRGYWAGEPLDAILRRGAERWPDRVAVIHGPTAWTYAELDARVDRRAASLRAHGLDPRDRVVLQLTNSARFLEIYFALLRADLVPVMALPGHRHADLAAFCRTTRAAGYIGAARLPGVATDEMLARVRAEVGASLRVTLRLDVDAPDEAPPASTPRPRARPDPRDVALLQLSGGSTGTPKLIARTHDDYAYSVRRSVEVCGFGPDTVYLVALPAAHNFPMSSPGFLGTLHAGGAVVMAPRADPAAVFALIEAHRVTVAAAVPPLAQTWSAAARARRPDLSSLRRLHVGGAKLTPERAADLQSALGCPVQQVFGMAEGLVCYTRHDDPEDVVLGTQGRPMCDDDEVRVVDDEDRDVPDGEVGHLLTRGPYTIRGYYDAPEHDARAFTADGFYRTGDRVRRTATGHLVVEGRAKEQINRGGEKIAPLELERFLLQVPGVAQAAVVGAADAVLGERTCAVVIREPEAALTRRDVLVALRDLGVATYKLPDRVVFAEALPRTKVGKIDKRRLAADLDGAEARPLEEARRA